MTTTEVPPELISQYNTFHEQRFNEFLEINKNGIWKLYKEDPEIVFYTGTLPNSSINIVKSTVSIPRSEEIILNELLTVDKIDPSTKSKDGTKERYIFGEVPNDEHHSGFIYVAVYSGSMFVTDRDFLLYRRLYKHEGSIYVLNVSIENDELKPEVKGNVRGNMTFQTFIIEKDPQNPENHLLSFVVHADPKGSIPIMVYNSAAISQGYTAKSIKKKCLK